MSARVLALSMMMALPLRAADAPRTDVGAVAFPNSGAPAAQKDFLYGLAQLHNFEYADAVEAFRRAEAADPGFAIAYWGEAMTFNHPIWQQQDLKAAREALAKLGQSREARLSKAKTQREKDYLDAVEVLYGEGSREERDVLYGDAMAALARRYPDDPDAQTFYALSLMGGVEDGRDIPIYMRAAAIAEDVFCAHPQHPGAAHYLIHAVDDPDHAVLGLRAARAYSNIAPQAAHAQHMTSHIFVALGMWDDVVHANEIATAMGRQRRQAKGQPPESCGHYDAWLEYGYLEQGHTRQALAALQSCREQASAEKPKDKAAVDADDSSVSAYVQMWSRFLIDTGDYAGDVARWEIDTKAAPGAHLTYAFTTGISALRRGEIDGARRALGSLRDAKKGILESLDAGKKQETSERKRADVLDQQLEGVILAAEGKGDEAVLMLTKAADAEAQIPAAFGPPFVDRPSAEALGETLLAMKRPREAMAAFQRALDRAPRRTAALLGLARAARAAHDERTAKQSFATLREIWHDADQLPADVAQTGP